MKKYLLILCVALMPMVALTSCSDDDDDPTLAETVAGTYDVKLAMAGAEATDGQIIITRKTDTTADLELKDFSIAGISLGSVKLTNPVDLKGTIAAVAIDHSETIKVTIAEGAPEMDVPLNLKGTITNGKTLALTVTATVVGAQIPVTVTGTKK